jgi:hypothetical protein
MAKATGGYAVKSVENEYGDDATAKRKASTSALPASITKDWLDRPDHEEIRLVWPVAGDDPPVQYPLSHRPSVASYSLEIHRAPEYIQPTARGLGTVPTVCACGEDLSFEWDEDEVVAPFGAATGIFAECDDCSRTFDPAKGSAVIENPFDKTKTKLPGGAAHRFALKVDCGESFVDDPRLSFHADLVAAVEKAFGREFYQVGCLR